ncbi:MAG: HTTM domain-containing protein [Pseudomonadota bacterium]
MDRLRLLFSIDLRSLAAMRIGLAITSLYALAVLAPDLATFYSDHGLTVRDWDAPHQRYGGLSVLLLSGGAWLAWLLWTVGVVASLIFLVGWRGRVAAAVLWVVWVSFTSRNAFVVQGGDQLMGLLLFWCMFLPISARFSVDQALTPQDRHGPQSICSVATVGLLLQVLYVYVFGALMKTSEVWFPNASAIYVALHLDTFVTGLGIWLREYGLLMQLLTLFVFLLELLTPILLFFPDARLWVRKVTLALLIDMHIGFRFFLHIGHFWMVSLSSLMAYVPSDWWNWLAAQWWRADQKRFEIWYDRDCGFCRKVALILKVFFLPPGIPVRPAQDHPEIGPLLEREVSWVVVDGTGRRWLHWDAVALVMRQNILLRPLGWLAALYGWVGLGRPTYDLIGRSRGDLGLVTRLLSAPRVLVGMPGRITSAALALIILLVFGWNLAHVTPLAPAIPAPAEVALRAAGKSQFWGMFAPSPPLRDSIPIVTVVDGDDANLFLKPPRADRFDHWVDHFPSHRWRKYLNNLRIMDEVTRKLYLRRYANHACGIAAARSPATAIRIELITRQTTAGFSRTEEVENWGTWPCPPPQ